MPPNRSRNLFEQLSFEQLLIFPGSDAASTSKKVSLPEPSSDASSHIDRDFQQNLVWINKYSPGRRVTQYYRLSYNWHGKKKHVHIPGGNVYSKLATYRAKKLQSAIDRGAELSELLAAIADYKQ